MLKDLNFSPANGAIKMRHKINGLMVATVLALLFGTFEATACGQEGVFALNGTALQYCNGTVWVTASSGGSLGACTTNGEISWSGSTLQVCANGQRYNASNGVNWGGCTGTLSQAGQFYYDPINADRYFYCNGTSYFGIPF
jgi:hypothetical protein